ncbi:hypothetical protein [uncultured Croceitalea sp.]|uniref:hypothetical protein n=1 Tax=uncultured Croceitalea sp. TaxID=1798908 RepID=UPI003305BE85
MFILPKVFRTGLLGLFLAIACTHNINGQTNVVLTSNSFNAKKQSGFKVAQVEEKLERGLTIVHFTATNEFEFHSYDTYGSADAVVEFTVMVGKMLKNKAAFAVLAHDSSVQGKLATSKELAALGLEQLALLKGRQAYIMHHVNGSIAEHVDDISTSTELTLSNVIADTTIYFPKIKYEFEPSNDRYIAHAGGEVNGIKSTNSKEALDQNYKKGFRLFELDIIKTSDGKLVAAHDWKMWARFTDFEGTLPPTHAEFMKRKIYGDYHTLDMKGINSWFKAHPDATLVTDKLNDPVAFANAFIDKDRLLMELFSVMTIDEASRNGIQAIISQEPLLRLRGDKINFLKINNVKYAAVSRRIIRSQTKLLEQLRDNGIKVYVYNVNFDAGKDERYVQENEIGLVYGMYADKWVFDEEHP